MSRPRSPERAVWYAMLSRCTKPSDANYCRYGLRGIRVCARWRESFDAFLADVGPRPSPKHSIDRPDNEGHYSCGACAECLERGWSANHRWATRTEQNRNRRSNRRITIDGETLCLIEWCERFGIDRGVVASRLRIGWDAVRALTTPVAAPEPITLTHDGETLTLREWAERLGMTRQALYERHQRGWTVAEILGHEPPPRIVSPDGRPLAEIARELGITKQALSSRIKHGWSVEEALSTPVATSAGRAYRSQHIPLEARGGLTVKEYAAKLGVSPVTLYRRLRRSA